MKTIGTLLAAILCACGSAASGPEDIGPDTGISLGADAGSQDSISIVETDAGIITPDAAAATDAEVADANTPPAPDAEAPDAIQITTCDPLEQDCEEGRACLMSPSVVGCYQHGAFAKGQTCSSLNECLPGLQCMTIGAASTCRSLCDYATWPLQNDPDRCAAGEICVTIEGPLQIGVCL